MSGRRRTVRDNLFYATLFAFFGALLLTGTADAGELTTPVAALTFGMMSVNIAVPASFMWGRR